MIIDSVIILLTLVRSSSSTDRAFETAFRKGVRFLLSRFTSLISSWGKNVRRSHSFISVNKEWSKFRFLISVNFCLFAQEKAPVPIDQMKRGLCYCAHMSLVQHKAEFRLNVLLQMFPNRPEYRRSLKLLRLCRHNRPGCFPAYFWFFELESNFINFSNQKSPWYRHDQLKNYQQSASSTFPSLEFWSNGWPVLYSSFGANSRGARATQ